MTFRKITISSAQNEKYIKILMHLGEQNNVSERLNSQLLICYQILYQEKLFSNWRKKNHREDENEVQDRIRQIH